MGAEDEFFGGGPKQGQEVLQVRPHWKTKKSWASYTVRSGKLLALTMEGWREGVPAAALDPVTSFDAEHLYYHTTASTLYELEIQTGKLTPYEVPSDVDMTSVVVYGRRPVLFLQFAEKLYWELDGRFVRVQAPNGEGQTWSDVCRIGDDIWATAVTRDESDGTTTYALYRLAMR